MFGSNSDEAKLAEQIYREHCETQLERDFPGKIVAIDIASKRFFVAEGILEVVQKVVDAKIETTVFVKEIGSKYGFFPWRPSLGIGSVKAFMDGHSAAYTIARKSDPSKAPFFGRKLDHGGKRSIMCWSTKASAEAFLRATKINAADLEVIEVSRADIERFIRSRSNSLSTYVVEMEPLATST